MAYEIKMLDLIDIELESSFLVLARNMGIRTRVKTWGYLILGPLTVPQQSLAYTPGYEVIRDKSDRRKRYDVLDIIDNLRRSSSRRCSEIISEKKESAVLQYGD